MPDCEDRKLSVRPARILLEGLVAGLGLFLLQNIAIWAAWVQLEKGPLQPLFYLQTHDMNQYLGFLSLAKTHTLFPNLHAPWTTTPAMFHPIFLVAGRLGAWWGGSPALIMNVLELGMYLGAGCILSWVLHVFLPTRGQRLAAVVATVCALPVMMLALGAASIVSSSLAPAFLLGVIDLSYTSADGLLRGGLSNSPTLTFGSATVLLALGLTAMRLRTGRRAWTLGLTATVFLSALAHPFEVFVIAPCAMAALLWMERRAWPEALSIALAAGAGVAPHALLSVLHPWFRELSQTFHFDASFGQFIWSYGLAFSAVPYLLLMGSRPQTRSDKLLLLTWAMTIPIVLLPGVPFPPHLLDGFAPITGILLVRLTAQPKFVAMYRAHPGGLRIALGVVLALTLIAYVGMYRRIWQDAASPGSGLPAASADRDQASIVDEFRRRAHVEDLALAPDPLSMMLITAPVHSFASHEHLSVDYPGQLASAARFYEGRMSPAEAEAFISGYGIHWIVVPGDSPALAYLATRREAFQRGSYRVFELPEMRMKPYPGLSAILPANTRQLPLSERVLRVLGL